MNQKRNNQKLAKMSKDLYLLEKQARDIYDDFLINLKDPVAVGIISQIRDDEVRHMELAKQLQEIAG